MQGQVIKGQPAAGVLRPPEVQNVLQVARIGMRMVPDDTTITFLISLSTFLLDYSTFDGKIVTVTESKRKMCYIFF